jgi:ribosome biogenesis protein ERB1
MPHCPPPLPANRSYPLFASSSDDATVHVFHGMVYSDLMTNPLIVPVKILRGHRTVKHQGVLDVVFHPTQPWIFTAGGDGEVCLFVDA